MTLFPCSIPDIPEQRSDVVAARLARKIGPLFGVPWAQSPFSLIWVCDFSRLTVNEMARGAPSPTRSSAAQWGPRTPPGQHQFIDRALVTHRRPGSARPDPAPNEIANATINRFGPDTKAAVVLVGANKLLEPVTAAVGQALQALQSRPRGSEARVPLPAVIAVWAALVLEAFRSQPALVRAALHAREIQRALHHGGGLPYAATAVRAEPEFVPGYAGRSATDDATRPISFDLLDRTVLAALFAAPADSPPVGDGPTHRVANAIADALAARLQDLGSPEGDGHLWLRDETDERRFAHAFVPYDPFLLDFVALADRVCAPIVPASSSPGEQLAMPDIPDRIPGTSPLARRAVLHGLCTLTWLAFGSGDHDPLADLDTLSTLQSLRSLARAEVPADDPILAVTECRVADMRLEVIRQDVSHDSLLPEAVRELTSALDAVAELASTGALDPALAADLLFSGNVEVLAVLRRHTVDSPVSGALPPGELLQWLYRSWARALRLLDLPDADPGAGAPSTLGFFLHNYATFLAGRDDENEARRSLELFESIVIPSRNGYFQRTGSFDQLVFSLQNASRAAARLSASAHDRGDVDAARRLARSAHDMIARAMTNSYVSRLLDRSAVDGSDEACRFALLAVPALLSALELGATDTVAEDVSRCDVLLDSAERFADRIAKGGGLYGRAAEIVTLRARLDALRFTS